MPDINDLERSSILCGPQFDLINLILLYSYKKSTVFTNAMQQLRQLKFYPVLMLNIEHNAVYLTLRNPVSDIAGFIFIFIGFWPILLGLFHYGHGRNTWARFSCVVGKKRPHMCDATSFIDKENRLAV